MEHLESVLGHSFRDRSLLTEALTHASLGYETQRTQPDNQRLEFLGDAVLQLLLSEILFDRYKDADEGLLTKTRAQLVSTKALAKVARGIQLGGFLLMGRGEESHGGRERDSSLADALEAVAGAVFIDGGMEAARHMAKRLFTAEIESLGASPVDQNPKGQLQEMLQAISPQSPSYRIIHESGPDHAKSFVAIVQWDGRELGRGHGRSKKEAEVEAARVALEAGPPTESAADYTTTRISNTTCENVG
ncbi:ribonuclease III [Brevifollis gellanilyticus]|uniref:Ribonuclease 3 n=1 Tax=Brevifollis gellanilyticus TaxID=748831 RepID=A0A512M247_9BACT|nr:ribonuclease III [Brevifollis gellanilyticus]GEP40817.1 ribonuclease 3 [Brevifollis gellanilyticus]